MYLIPTEVVRPHINPYFIKDYAGWHLLGFMPCSDNSESVTKYFSVDTPHGRVVPVYFLDHGYGDANQPVLFFHGNDDGHTGLPFASIDEAREWIKNCPYAEFDQLFTAAGKHLSDIPKLLFFN